MSGRGFFSGAVAVLAVFTAVSWGQSGGAGYRLAYQFTPGQALHYEVSQTMTVRTQYGEATETITSESTARKHFTVLNVDADGVAELEPMIDSARMSTRFNDLTPTVFDSEKSDVVPTQYRDVKESLGKSMARLSYDPAGTLKKIESLDPKIQISKADPKYGFLIPLPAQPVSIGESWTDRMPIPVTLPNKLTQNVTLQRTFTLTAVKENIATIGLKTAVITPISDPQIEAQLIQRKPTGVIEFDLERGCVVSLATKSEEQVVNPFGPKSLMNASSETKEKLTKSERLNTAAQPARLPNR